MKRVHVVIRGDVQNVGFRSWTKAKAGHFGVAGWVKNTDDGAVEAVFEAEDEKKVDELVEECRRGPPGSYVEGVDVEEEVFRGEFEGFDIII